MEHGPTVLVIAPHPDDEVLGCGGSICAHLGAGRSVGVAYLTSGEHASPTETPEVTKSIREAEAVVAMERLGIRKSALKFLRFGDGKINEHNDEQFVRLVDLIRTLRPRVLYVPHDKEVAHDHHQANCLVMRAADMAQSANYRPTRKRPSWRVPIVLAYEVWTPLAKYQYLENITNFVEQKVDALRAYRSQSYATKRQATYAGPAGVALAAYRGAMSLGGYAEAFEVLRADCLFTGLPR